jgi:hypothetical protein
VQMAGLWGKPACLVTITGKSGTCIHCRPERIRASRGLQCRRFPTADGDAQPSTPSDGGIMGGCKLVLTNTFLARSPTAAVPLLMRIVGRSAFSRDLRGMLSDKLQDESRGSQLPSRKAVLTVSARLTACSQHWAGPGGTVSHNADLSGPVASGGQRVV